MEPQTPARAGPPVSPCLQHRSTRKKSCRRCVQAKTRCDLGKPKCKRCVTRSTICEYPAAIDLHNGTSGENSYHHADPSLLTMPSEILSLNPALSSGLGQGIGHVSHNRSHSTATSDESTIADPSLVMDFQNIDLAAMAEAEEIRDRWLRPYISDSTGQEPKQLSTHTIQYLTCVLKSYLRNLLESLEPPFVHTLQQRGSHTPALAHCFTLVRMWLTRIPGSEPLILETMRGEMKKIEDQNAFSNDIDGLCSFQAYLLYFMALHFFPTTDGIEETYLANTQTQIKMQEIAFRSAKTGLVCKAEELKTRPRWESWIVASAKRRTLFTMYLFTNVYNTQIGLPNFVAEELRGTMVPESKALWEASSRAVWERTYNRHLSRWEDGMLEISELWKSPETGTDAQRERIERWLQSADEFGMMLFAVCAHIHGC